MFTHCNLAFSLRLRQTRLLQPLEFTQPRTESPTLLAPERCRSARRPSGQDSTGPSFGLTDPAKSHRSDAFPQRTSPSDSPLRCKLSRSGRFSPLPSAPSPEVSLQNPERALPEQAKPRNSERLAGRSTPLPLSPQLATARLLGARTGKGKGLGRGGRRGMEFWEHQAGSRSQTSRRRGLQLPEGSATTTTPQSPTYTPPPASSFGFCLGFSFWKRGDPGGQIAPPSRVTSALKSVVRPRPLKASKWRDAISCSRYHPRGRWERADVTFPSGADFPLSLISGCSGDVLYIHHVLEPYGYQGKLVWKKNCWIGTFPSLTRHLGFLKFLTCWQITHKPERRFGRILSTLSPSLTVSPRATPNKHTTK